MVDLPNHFFKFIPPGFKFNLSIPKSFLANLNGWKCKTAILKRGCHKWPVHITDEGVFGDGWKKFVIDNGVQELDFIVFKHQGNMVFDFFVFDQSTYERKYPNLFEDIQQSPRESKKLKIMDALKSTDCSSPRKDESLLNFYNLGKKPSHNHIQAQKGTSSTIRKTSSTSYFTSTMKPYSFHKSRLYLPNEFSMSNDLRTGETILRDDQGRSWKVQLNKKIGENRLYLGRGFRDFRFASGLKEGDAYKFELVENKKDKPLLFNFSILGKKLVKNHIQLRETSSTPYFTSTLKPYSFKKSCLYLPAEFSMSNDLRMGETILRDDKGRSWKAKLNKDGESRFYLGCGFRDFWAANGLREGDEYKLELVENEKDKPLVVNFSRKQLVKNRIKIKGTCSTPYFTSTLKPHSLKKSCLYIPAEFSMSNDLRTGETILRDDKGRSWKVQLNKMGENRFYLGCGFRDFWVANGLREGDEYKLELVENEKDKPLVVNFSRKKLVENRIKIKGNCSTPYITSTLKPYTFKRSHLYIPADFSMSNDLRTGETILIDDKGRSWKVQLSNMGKNRFYLGCGFRDFWVANRLREGDEYKLELVENEKDKPPVINFSRKKLVENRIKIKGTCSTPYITSTLKPYTIKRSRLYIPAEFSMSNDLRTGETILRDDKGRSWKVQLNNMGKNRFYLGCGFRDFWVANGLREGDEYKLELVENEKEKEKSLIWNFSIIGRKPIKKHIETMETTSTVKKAITGSSLGIYPSFLLTMKPSFKKSGLYLPVEFALSNGLEVGQMILQDDKGRSWKIQLNKVGEKHFYFKSGLRAFWDANRFKVGDVYKFVLVKKEKGKPPVMKASCTALSV